MSEHEFYSFLNEFDPTIKKLSRSYNNIPGMEWEDIAQELRLCLILRFGAVRDPIKSMNNWAYIVCRNKIKDLYRFTLRKKRDYRLVVSLESCPIEL